MKKSFKWGVCGLFILSAFGVAYAEFAKPEEAIEYRQATMTLIGYHFGRIGTMVQGKKPLDKTILAKDADLVATLTTLPWEAFMSPGADKGKTHVKAEALKDKEAFKTLTGATMTETAKLAQVSTGADMEAVKSQFGAVGKTCQACHEKFRTH